MKMLDDGWIEHNATGYISFIPECLERTMFVRYKLKNGLDYNPHRVDRLSWQDVGVYSIIAYKPEAP